MNPEYFWELVQFDGAVILIPPNAVETVKRRWDNGDPIHLRSGSIPHNQIKAFRLTDKQYNSQPAIEAVAQAFHEPLTGEDGSIKARWVKKNVTQANWSKHYHAIPSYHQIGDFNGMVTVAFRLAVHDIDTNLVEPCTDEEVNRLTNK